MTYKFYSTLLTYLLTLDAAATTLVGMLHLASKTFVTAWAKVDFLGQKLRLACMDRNGLRPSTAAVGVDADR